MRFATLLVLSLLAAFPARSASQAAAPHPEGWCADAVDFAMRTAQYRGFGRTEQKSLTSIRKDADVFHQQYPDLSTADMLKIAHDVYDHDWSHFGAAAAMSKACPAAPETTPPARVLRASHSDEWCADAVDFAMGAAQNRELRYSQEMIAGSLDKDPVFFHMNYPSLSREDMHDITDAVFERRWTRFTAAVAVSASCRTEGGLPPSQTQE